MGDFTNTFVVLIVCIGCYESSASRHRRPQISHPLSYGLRDKLVQNRDLKQFMDHRNLAGTDCIHNLCTNLTNYPSNNIRNIIYNKKEYHKLFGPVIQPYSPPTLSGKSPSITEGFDEKNMCATRQYTHYPQTALNRYRKRVVIVNVDDFKQAVSFEICIPNAKCFMDDHRPLHYETSCKQQFTLIRLVSVEENGNVSLDNIPIPSSCVCTYKRTV